MSIEKRELICVTCPNGCRLTVAVETDDCPSPLPTPPRIVSVAGAVCKRGGEYAAQECVAPKRMVTTLVRVAERRAPLSVKTSAPIPKEMISEILAAAHTLTINSPIRIGDVVIADVCGTGTDIVATSAAN